MMWTRKAIDEQRELPGVGEPPIEVKLLREANDAYPDGMIASYFDMDTGEEIAGGTGDTLAEFVGREVLEVSRGIEDEAQARQEAVGALERAVNEINQVILALGR